MVTLDELKGCKLSMSMHFDGPRGPKGFFGDVHQCIEHPRLQRKTTYYRATKSGVVEWMVDGVKVGDKLEDVIEPLNKPAVTTPEEAEALAFVTGDWQGWRLVGDFQLVSSLRAKGLIEVEDGRVRLAQVKL